MNSGFVRLETGVVVILSLLCISGTPAYSQNFSYAFYTNSSGQLVKTGKLDHPEATKQVLYGTVIQDGNTPATNRVKPVPSNNRAIPLTVYKKPKTSTKKPKWKLVSSSVGRVYSPVSIPENYYKKPLRHAKEQKAKQEQLAFEAKLDNLIDEYGLKLQSNKINEREKRNTLKEILAALEIDKIEILEHGSGDKIRGSVIESYSPNDFFASVDYATAKLNVAIRNKDNFKGKVLSYQSPLMLDTNNDGVINTKIGMGIDINGDNKPDGTAISGDLVLVMSDLNNNGVIDGTEVFGNNTINPVTQMTMEASNGFEALITIADYLQKTTGINCYNDKSFIDLYKIREAMQKATNNKVTLGYISDDNITSLEPLESVDVKSININYSENSYDKNDSIQSRQTSFYLSRDGKKHKIDDIWFKTKE